MKRGAPLRRTPMHARRAPLPQGAPLHRTVGLSRGCALNPVSKKRRGENAVYAKLRAEFLTTRPVCEMPTGCHAAATDVHHRAGRVGALLLDVTRWSALCRPHHIYVTEHPAEAVALGISELRIGAA